MKLQTLIPAFVVLLASGAAAAQTTVPLVDRPMVIQEGQGTLSFDITVALNEGAAGRSGGIYSDLAQEPWGGLSASYGFAKGIEAGISLPWIFTDISVDKVQAFNTAMSGWPMFLEAENRSHFQPLNIWARFRLRDWVAVDLTVMVPLEEIKANQFGAAAGLPFKFILLPGHLALHFRPEIKFGFANQRRTFGEYTQITLFMDAGLTANITRELFMDLTIGYGRTLLPSPDNLVVEEYMGEPGYSGSGWLPLSLTIGYSVIPSLDLFAGFTLTNLAPEGSLEPVDGRSLTIGLDYRF